MELRINLRIVLFAHYIISYFLSVDSSLIERIRAEREQARAEPIRFNLPRSRRPLGATKTNKDTELIGRFSNINIRIYRQYRGRAEEPTVLEVLNDQECAQPKPLSCNPWSTYRSIDGTCNNLIQPRAGSHKTLLVRALRAEYEDGFDEPKRTSRATGAPLPNPRLVSSVIDIDVSHPDPTATNMVPQIGQVRDYLKFGIFYHPHIVVLKAKFDVYDFFIKFLDHDISLTPESDRACCGDEAEHEDCDPIIIPENDPFYSKLINPQTCMNFTRSTAFCFPGRDAIREQFNLNTAFIDGSQIYGSDDTRAKRLRLLKHGLLRDTAEYTGIPVTVAEIEEIHDVKIEFEGKYYGGDARVNEMPALTTMHILLHREHNRIAREVKKWTNWNDEEIYQFSRRIVIAEWQKIIYHDYLPVIMGEDAMKRFDLNVLERTWPLYSRYQYWADPSVTNSFATAAYRFGHSLLNGMLELYRGTTHSGTYELSKNFFISDQFEKNNFDGYNIILGGLMIQNSEGFDPFVTTEVTNFLFREKGSSFGADLIARNIQRGRDHGLPSYSDFRQFCWLQPLTRDWNNRPYEICNSTWVKLSQVYQYPVDIDLFTGGLAEYAVVGGLSGPTFNCLKAREFWSLKFGDRYFFTHYDQPKRFSPTQLHQLQQRTLSNILCENSNLNHVTINAFRVPSRRNPMVRCSQIRRGALNILTFLT